MRPSERGIDAASRRGRRVTDAPHSRADHYSYSVYADPAMAEAFDALRFSGPIGRLIATTQEEVIASFLAPLAGRTVLDVGTGTGRAAIALAARGARVTGVDASAEMLAVAERRAKEAGVGVTFTPGDAHGLAFSDRSFDAVICRLGLMLFNDPAKALRSMRRVVKPGGKVAVLLFSAVEKNPYEGIPRTVAHRRGRHMPRVFVLGEQRLVEDAFRNGGFSKFSVHTVATHRRFSSSTEAVKALQDDFHGSAINELPNSEHEDAWQEVEQQLRGFEGPNGCELPGELLIGVGTK